MFAFRLKLLALVFCLTGLAGLAQAGQVKIGFLVKQPEEPWFQLEWKFADQAAQELGFDVMKIGTPDGEKVLTAIDNLAASGAQGFVICTPDVLLGPAIVAKARANNLKVLAVDDRFVGPVAQFFFPFMEQVVDAVVGRLCPKSLGVLNRE